MPLTPLILHVPVPVGVAPPLAPETFAVKVKLEPRVEVGVLVVIATVGDTLVITRLKVVLGPA